MTKLRDPEAFDRNLLSACSADVVFRSRRAQWIAAHPYEVDGRDFLHAVLKSAGTHPASFPNFASLVAYVLSLPTPEAPAKRLPTTVIEDGRPVIKK
jgi:hypothetical protein